MIIEDLSNTFLTIYDPELDDKGAHLIYYYLNTWKLKIPYSQSLILFMIIKKIFYEYYAV